MKRILHISKYYHPFKGGIEQTARDCVNALKGLYDQKVICFNDCGEDKADEIDQIEVIRAGTVATIASQGLSLTMGKILKNVLRSYKPDVVIFHYPNPFVAHYLLKYIDLTSKLVVYWHLDIVKQKFLRTFFVGQNKRLIDRASFIIATSPNYIVGSPYLSSAKNKCVVIPSCINEDRLHVTSDVEKRSKEIRKENIDKTICLAVGRHTEYKGFKYLIQAAHLLDDSFEIFITGKGEETENLKTEAADDKKIHFLGLVNDVELKAYLMAMDIFCFPSITKNEAYGLALAEGMYYGKPTVTFTIPGSGVNYVSINGETGIEVENKNIEKYAKAIKLVANDDELRSMMGKNAKIRVEENFLFKTFKVSISTMIERLL